MKRFFLIALIMLMLLPAVHGETRRVKPLEMAANTFMEKYETTPFTLFYGKHVPLAFTDTGISNYRRMYLSPIDDHFLVSLTTDDLSDQVCIFSCLLTGISDMPYTEAYEYIDALYRVAARATNIILSPITKGEVDEILLKELDYHQAFLHPGYSASATRSGIVVSIASDATQAVFAIYSADSYPSEEAFLEQRPPE